MWNIICVWPKAAFLIQSDCGLVSCKLLFSHNLFARLKKNKTIGRLVQTIQRYKCSLKRLANEYGKEPLYLFHFTAPIIKIYLRMLVERISQWIWKHFFSLTICFSTKKQDKSWYDIRIEHFEECGIFLSLTIRLQQKIDDYVYWK